MITISSQAELAILISAQDKASQALKGVGGSAEGLGSKLKALIAPLAAISAGFLSWKSIQSAVSTTQELASSVSKLSRETGLSAESSSQLLYAFKRVGLDADDASRSLGLFAKNMTTIAEAEDSGIKASKTTVELLKELGIKALDASGNVRPMNVLLNETADRFSKMPNGIEKTGMSMQLFGKSGKDLIPLLNLGSAGLAEYAKQADKLGVTLSAKNLEAVKKYTAEQRILGEAVNGIKLQVGLALIPVLTTLVAVLVTVSEHVRTWTMRAIDLTQKAILPLIDKLKPAYELVKSFGQAALSSSDGIVGLGGAITVTLLPSLVSLGSSIGGILQTVAVLTLGWGALIVVGAALAIGLFELYKHSATFRAELDTLKTTVMNVATSFAQGIIPAVTEAVRLFTLGLSGGQMGGELTLIQTAAFGLGEIFRNTLIPNFKIAAEAVRLFFLGLQGGTGGGFTGIQKQALEFGQQVRQVFQTEIVPAVKAFADIVATTAALVAAHWDTIRPVFKFVAEFVIARIKGIVQEIHGVIEVVSGTIQLIDDAIHGRWSEVWDDAKLIVAGAIDILIGSIKEQFGNLPEIMLELGKQAIAGFVKGIKSVDVRKIAGDIANDMSFGITGALGIRSPSTVMKGYGENTMKGFEVGLAAGTEPVKKVMLGMTSFIENVGVSWTQAAQNAAAGVVAAANKAADAWRLVGAPSSAAPSGGAGSNWNGNGPAPGTGGGGGSTSSGSGGGGYSSGGFTGVGSGGGPQLIWDPKMGGGGPSSVGGSITVHVNVAGSILSERELLRVVRSAIDGGGLRGYV